MKDRTRGRTFTSSFFDCVKRLVLTNVAAASEGARGGKQFPSPIPPDCKSDAVPFD
jgi:hypothetical protein